MADVIGAKEAVVALFLDSAGSTFAMLQWMKMQGAKLEEQSPLEFNSFCHADPEIMTGMVHEEHLILAGVFQLDFVDQLIVSKELGVRRVYQQHLERIQRRSPIQFSLDQATYEFNKHGQRRFEWLLQRGFLRRLSERDINRVRQCRLP
jgi:hypothetical protein